MTQPLQPQITTARVTYAGGRVRTFACATLRDVQLLTDRHWLTHARPVAFLAADGTVVVQFPPAPPPVVLRCRMCGQHLRRIGQGHGHFGQNLFCSADCGYSYAVTTILDEERAHAVMTSAEVAQRRGQERTDARLADERARGAAMTADMLTRTRGGR